MAFASRPGCPMCSIVQSASHATANSPRSPSFPAGSTNPEVLWRDENFTVYREKGHAVSSKGHIIVAFKQVHVSTLPCSMLISVQPPRSLHIHSRASLSSTLSHLTSLQSSSDLPLLVNIRNLATRILTSLLLPAASPSTSTHPLAHENLFRIGFITPPFKDNKIPVTDHLHCHAYIAPPDLMGWWRGIAFGPLAWYPIDDLIAEIRESVSNNRVKSGYENRHRPPIDMVPSAGARSGTADGTETSEPSITNEVDLEDGEGITPARLVSPRSPEALTPQSRIPSLRV
ncbi:hypothetical protein C0995_001695 [Termitomyces sp. Mi166|nr:hypothetical protein C0995_001695 [Termitomyces sp. Mi166\